MKTPPPSPITIENAILLGITAAVLYCTWPVIATLFLVDYFHPLQDAAKAEWYA